MIALLPYLTSPTAERIAMMLLHFIWQGSLIAGAAALLSTLFHSAGSQVRYGIHLVALLLMVAAPVMTFALGEITSQVTVAASEIQLARTLLPASANSAFQSAEQPAPANVLDWRAAMSLWRPWLLIAWCVGVALLSLRLIGAALAVQWISGARQDPPVWLLDTRQRLCRRMGIASTRVALSQRVTEAVVVGLWRPLVLIPAAWTCEVPPSALEAILAHELAHVRRSDLWVNLLQRLLETIFFYHPAVWWTSRRLTMEREMCCDELAVAVTGDRLAYVCALELVASRWRARVRPSLAAGIGDRKMVLLDRVRNVLSQPSHRRGAGWWPVGVLMFSLPLATWLALASAANVGAADDENPNPAGKVKRDGDVPRAADAPRDRDRPRAEGERPREADRPRAKEERSREGDRPRTDGDRPREGDRPRGELERSRESERNPFFPRREGEREGNRPRGPVGERELIELVRQLRAEIEQLRREVNTIRERPYPPREGFRPDGPPRGVERPRLEGARPDGERRPELRDRDRPRPEGARDGDRPQPKEGDRN